MPDLHWNLFFDESPYADFEPRHYPDDMQGWGWNERLFRAVIEGIRPRAICEVGTWKGSSAINMARVCRELGLETKILCVDTWLGSPEHWRAGRDHNWFTSLKLRNGLPQIYYTFLANVVRHEMQDMIIPLPMPSDNAAEVIAAHGLSFDLIYVDAAHHYDAVLRDLRLFWPMLGPQGVLMGDDYGAGWVGVTQAVTAFAAEIKLPLFGEINKFLLSRRRMDVQLSISFP